MDVMCQTFPKNYILFRLPKPAHAVTPTNSQLQDGGLYISGTMEPWYLFFTDNTNKPDNRIHPKGGGGEMFFKQNVALFNELLSAFTVLSENWIR